MTQPEQRTETPSGDEPRGDWGDVMFLIVDDDEDAEGEEGDSDRADDDED